MDHASCRPFAAPGVQGVLHRPGGVGRGGLVLAHGAGGDRDAPALAAAASAFAAAGWTVLRIDLPFRQLRPKGPPPRGSGPEDRAGLRRAAAEMRRLAPGPLVLGGHSYGGRQAAMLGAEDSAVADALLLLSYPLHPPRKPESPRTAHFPNLRLPTVFVHGEKDDFGAPDEVTAAAALIPAPARVLIAPAAGHDLKRGRIDFEPARQALTELLERRGA